MGMDSNTANGGYDQSVDWVSMSLMSVEYPKGNTFGKLLALFSLIPCAIIPGLISLIVFSRDSQVISFFAGVVLNQVCNIVLKYIIREPRPLVRNKNIFKSEYGMPSSHSQFIWFIASYILHYTFSCRLQYATNRVSKEFFWNISGAVTSIVIACIVSYSRIFLRYHTWRQVIYGAFLGTMMGTLWFSLCYKSPDVVSLKIQ